MALTKQDLSAIDQIVTKRIKPVTDDVKSLKKDMSQVKRDLKTTINFFDKEYLALKKRVVKTEFELGIPAPEL